MWCPWEGGSGNPRPSQVKILFDPMEQGRGLKPKTNGFCLDHVLLEKHASHPKWCIWDRLQFCFPGGMGNFPGVHADQKGFAKLGYRPYFLPGTPC